MCNGMDDFFGFLGYREAMEKTNEFYNDKSLKEFDNIEGSFGNPVTTKYPYVSAFANDYSNRGDFTDDEFDEEDEDYD